MKSFVICSGGMESVSLADRIAADQNCSGFCPLPFEEKRRSIRSAAHSVVLLDVSAQILDARVAHQRHDGHLWLRSTGQPQRRHDIRTRRRAAEQTLFAGHANPLDQIGTGIAARQDG